MRYVGGVDVGSTQTKAVILDENGKVVGRALLDMETSMVTIAQDAFRAALADAGLQEEQVARVASTGYGRYNVSFGDEQVTEITCHARGAVALFPGTRTVIDIGGQDTKAIAVKPDGVLMGVHQAITSRCVSLARRVGVHSEVTFTGGVSRNVAIVKLLEDAVGMKINVSPDAHFCGALGAALFAREHAFAPAAEPAETLAQEAA